MNVIDQSVALVAAVADLEEEIALKLVRQRLDAGDDPLRVILDCQEGLHQVGLRYEQNEYYLAGLIMGGEILRQVMDMAQPLIERQVSGHASGRILLGTVQGDIHDLGKNIVNMLLSCHNFVVHDLGVDVSPTTFVEQAAEIRPDIVCLSGLLTSAYDAMHETVTQLRARGYQGPIMIGGGQLNEQVFQYVGADYWVTDAVAGVDLCRRLVADKAQKSEGSGYTQYKLEKEPGLF
ncbi:MAG: cobalamin-dependent protein [Anaerolineae bacterium]|nr:cobalamin-dependent protein [Anaerolineae bacterium]